MPPEEETPVEKAARLFGVWLPAWRQLEILQAQRAVLRLAGDGTVYDAMTGEEPDCSPELRAILAAALSSPKLALKRCDSCLELVVTTKAKKRCRRCPGSLSLVKL